MIEINKGSSMKWAKYRGYIICNVLRNLAPFVQFKKREKHPWRSVTFPATMLKVTLHNDFFDVF